MATQLTATLLLLPALLTQPDATTTALTAPARQASSTPVGSAAYSIGATTCNLGNSVLPFTPQNLPVHPVYAQNLFRLRGGRIEQVGLSWAFHEFCPLQGGACATCTPHPVTCEALGVGCSTADTASIAGTRNALGPRSQINPASGVYTYPNTLPSVAFPSGKIHVQNSDLDPALNSGAVYFSEVVIVAPSDAAAGNNTNNASHRQVTVGAFTNGAWTLVNAGATQFDQQPAILSLQRLSPPGSVLTSTLDIPGDGRIILASAAWFDGPRSWRYEYAVYNLSSDRAVGRFTVPIVPNLYIDVTGTAFLGVTHHSGEIWASDPWTVTHQIGNVTDHWEWATQTFAANPNANAIRWGTLYNFTLYSDSPPAAGQVSLGLFKPGAGDEFSAAAFVPTQACAADFDHSGTREVPDIFFFLSAWFALDPTADVDGMAGIGVPDIFFFLSTWFAGCP